MKELINNEDGKQFELHIDGKIAKIEYIRAKEKIYLTHTEVPKGLEGQGIGTEMIRQALEFIKEQGLTLVPLCPFVALYLKRNPEWKSLVLKGINIA
nr:GNAT family N-acetyltransferase [Allomuricauda sp.]